MIPFHLGVLKVSLKWLTSCLCYWKLKTGEAHGRDYAEWKLFHVINVTQSSSYLVSYRTPSGPISRALLYILSVYSGGEALLFHPLYNCGCSIRCRRKAQWMGFCHSCRLQAPDWNQIGGGSLGQETPRDHPVPCLFFLWCMLASYSHVGFVKCRCR